MDAFLLAFVAAIAAYSVYEIGYAIYDARSGPPEEKLDDALLGKTAVVCRRFSEPGKASVRTGAIELNGVIWEAETANSDNDLDIGDSCKISDRTGLRLVVEPESAKGTFTVDDGEIS